MEQKILYGRKPDEEIWKEIILTEREKLFPEAKEWAEKKGYITYVKIINLDSPNFIETIII